MGLLDWDEKPKRKPFLISRKKIEWMRASGRDPFRAFVKTSKCRACKKPLRWGDGRYEFDHKDNNSSNNSQKNCYLVCRNCHGKHTVIKKRKIKGIFGEVIGHKTIKKKVGYKKKRKTAKKPRKKKRRSSSIWDFGL